ncbi:hypothetical protein [Schlesneria paludicola]|nr:hypothetical protein [Schlesneria paludicola]
MPPFKKAIEELAAIKPTNLRALRVHLPALNACATRMRQKSK